MTVEQTDQKSKHGRWRPFEAAQDYVRGLGLTTQRAWRTWFRTRACPGDIPAAPDQVYRDAGWRGWRDFLGTAPAGQSAQEQFWLCVDKTSDCWLWRYGGKKCGVFRLDGRRYDPHRLSYEWTYGPLPAGYVLQRTCGNTQCVRPGHLTAVRRGSWRAGRRPAPGVGQVPLTKGKVALVDPEDWDRVVAHSWSLLGPIGVDRRLWYAQATIDGSPITLHRFLMQPPNGLDVDHINGDTLDCRRSNMRLATASQNAVNRYAPIRARSGYRGVVLQPNGAYVARCGIRGKQRYLGYFRDPIAAARAYDAAMRAAFGPFARTNFGDTDQKETTALAAEGS